MSAVRRTSVIAAGGLALTALAGLPAAAEPRNEHLPLTCAGTTYNVVVNGRGDFVPARDTASGRVFVPVEFGPFTAVIRNAAGVEQDRFTDPPLRKGSSSKRDTVTCSFTVSFVGTGAEGDLPLGWTFTGEGTVTAKVVGGR